MIWIAARWLLGRLSGLWRVIAAHPWPFVVAALCGLSWALLERGNRYRDDLVATLEAQQAAEDMARAAIAAKEREYKDKANAADLTYQTQLADARSDTERYIATHRVQPKGASCQAAAPAEGPGASVPDPVPTDVIVDQADVLACGNLYAYAVNAHDWAQAIRK